MSSANFIFLLVVGLFHGRTRYCRAAAAIRLFGRLVVSLQVRGQGLGRPQGGHAQQHQQAVLQEDRFSRARGLIA